MLTSARSLAGVATLVIVSGLSGCGTQLRSGEHDACSPGIDEWMAQVASEEVMAVPSDATAVQRIGINACPRVPVVGVFGGNSLVQLVTRYDTSEAEEQGTIRLENAAGLSDWSSFEGGGDCQMKLIDSVPSFLTISSDNESFMITVRRGDPSLCDTATSPNPGETAAPTN